MEAEGQAVWFELYVEATHQTINAADESFALVRDPDGNLLGLWTR